MSKYNHKEVEKKWKKNWEKSEIYKTKEPSFAKATAGKAKYYVLDMFPYPSGAGLHVGHPKGYIATDIVARMKMMQGFNVLHPMGWDAFGLPAENYALKNKVHPSDGTAKNVATFKKQLGLLGFTYDWDREVNTTDPKYYKWTQWIFLQMFKKGLAFESFAPINWCPDCKTGLANEDLEGGLCERCGSEIERKPMRQWVLRITDYAEKLLSGLDTLTAWPEHIKKMQSDWIGKSEGALVDFKIKDSDQTLKVFTTRPDTLFGATYMVVAPEHPLISENLDKISNKKAVQEYIEVAKSKSDLERTELQKEKTGVELKGLKAINPLTNEELSIFMADYVLFGYGTGAIMSVPGHDERDWEFAKKYKLPIVDVVLPVNEKGDVLFDANNLSDKPFTEDGVAVNSDFINNLPTPQAKEKMLSYLEEKGIGQRKIQYKLRDWVFSRQRYWGEPIPLVHCEQCQNKKYNYIILHGFSGTADKNGPNRGESNNWRPWIKSKLEDKGNKVFCPNLPNTFEPNIEEQVQYVIDNVGFEINDGTIIVGHSLGAVVIYRLLEKLNKKVGKVVLVDPVVTDNFVDHERPKVTKSCNWKFNFEKIKKLSKEFIVLGDSDFGVIFEKDIKDLVENLTAKLILSKPSAGHFTAEQEPSVWGVLDQNGWVPVPEKDLPLELPKVKNYEPSGTGESPLATISDWVNTSCPQCGGPAKRETNTMPQWAGSCWYYLRYEDPHNTKELVSKEKEKYWSPIDLYVGGAEHATRHLIYARFWHKFLFDIGMVNYDEPFTRLQNVGLILAEDGRKMSKRWNNVINPDDVVEEYGADAMRLYEMFMGPFDQPCAWSTKGVVGVRRFLERAWTLAEKVKSDIVIPVKTGIHGVGSPIKSGMTTVLHQTIKKVSEDILALHFNTAISSMMELVNEMNKVPNVSKEDFVLLLQLLSPFAPHITEELWSQVGNKGSIFESVWPQHNAELAKDTEITLAIQINGKLRDTILVSADISEEEAKQASLNSEKVQKWLEGKTPKKVIYVKNKLVSIVV
ncbi:MAG: leucine--tRNA ligase [Candidatus Magasanikbacteria bacterium]